MAAHNCEAAFRPVIWSFDTPQTSADPFAPFVSGYDPVFERSLPSSLNQRLSFQTLEYDAPVGYEVKDDGFVPAVRNLGRSHRVLTQIDGQLTIDRNPSVDFLNEVRGHVVKAALSKYTGVVPDHIIKAIERAEDKLPPGQSSIGVVRDRESGEILGTIRIYHGVVASGKIILPSTEVLRELGSMTEEFDNKLLRLASGSENPSAMSLAYPKRILIEVGQLSIRSTLTPEMHEAVRNLLFQWVEIRLQESAGQFGLIQEPLVIAHVAGRKHAVLYRRQFGIKDEVFKVPNQAQSKGANAEKHPSKEDHESVLSIGAAEAIKNSARTRERKN